MIILYYSSSLCTTVIHFDNFLNKIKIGLNTFSYKGVAKFPKLNIITNHDSQEVDVVYKGLVSEIALEVGNSSAMVLNQLYQWVKSKNRTTIFRTNQEIKDDLDGLLSTATIQRSKKKLVDKGYVTISFKKGFNRVTYFTLTEKALKFLGKVKDEVVTETKKAVVEVKKAVVKPVAQTTKKMTALFDEQGTRTKPSPIPEHLLKMLKGKLPEKKEEVVVVVEENTGISEEDWLNIDKAQGANVKTSSTLSMNQLVDLAFKQIPNIDVFESNRQIKENALLFSEDY